MVLRQPGWGRSGGRRQARLNPVPVQQIKHTIQPAKFVMAWTRLQMRPGEDAQRHQVDARRLHQAHVLLPDSFGPLFRVIVAAIPDARVL